MAITPSQEKFINPYEFIITHNAVNTELSKALGDINKGIVSGLELVILDSTTLRVSYGIGVVDKVVVKFPNNTSCTVIGLGAQNNVENVVYIRYQYNLSTPVPQATIQAEATSGFSNSDQNLILGFITLDSSGNILNVTSDSSVNSSLKRDLQIFENFLTNKFFVEAPKGKSEVDFWIKNKKIVNLGVDENSFVHDLEVVNKVYVDSNLTSSQTSDDKVKTDSQDLQSDFLDNKIEVDGTILTKTIIGAPSNPRQIQLNKVDRLLKVTSGDSTKYYI